MKTSLFTAADALLELAILTTVVFFLGFIVVGGAHIVNAIEGVL